MYSPKLSSLLALLLTGSLCAVPTPTAPKPVQGIPSRVDVTSHVLAPGDQVEVHVYSMPELEKVYEVRADGSFFHPLIGEVQARGMTLTQLEAALKPRFQKELRRSKFRIGLHSLAEGEASVMGEVKTQGMFKFAPGSSAMDLIAHAGGLTNKADLDGAVLLRAGNPIPLNLNKGNQTSLASLLVQSGDVIFVHPGKRVGVSGEVHEKGLYAVSSTRGTIEDAIKAAGGATSTAALHRVQITRATEPKPLIVNLLAKSGQDPDALMDGDTVVVPARRAVVMGAVDKPGPVNLTGTEKLTDVISTVGVSKGRLDRVIVIRDADVQKVEIDPNALASKGLTPVAKVDGEPKVEPKKEEYDLEKFFSEGQGGPSVPLYDGDVVFVPEKGAQENFLTSNGLMNLIFTARSLFSF